MKAAQINYIMKELDSLTRIGKDKIEKKYNSKRVFLTDDEKVIELNAGRYKVVSLEAWKADRDKHRWRNSGEMITFDVEVSVDENGKQAEMESFCLEIKATEREIMLGDEAKALETLAAVTDKVASL